MVELDDWVFDLTENRKPTNARNPVTRQCSREANDGVPTPAPRPYLNGPGPTRWFVIGLVPRPGRKQGLSFDICGLPMTKMAGSPKRYGG